MLSVLVLISGSGSNLLALLKAAEHPLFPAKILAVGSDKPASGLAHADLYGVPTFVVEPAMFSDTQSWAKKLEENISHYNPDLIVLAGFMKILPSSFVHTFAPRFILLTKASTLVRFWVNSLWLYFHQMTRQACTKELRC